MNKQTVLITGASGGIGKECALIFAKNGYNVVLVARGADKLNQIKSEIEKSFNVAATVVPADLTAGGAAEKVSQTLREQGVTVDVLINNAGFGDYAAFLDSDLQKQKNMIDLNCSSLVETTHVFGNEMKKRGFGRIVNIASIAAFQPGPYMSVYFASKSFVMSFSHALSHELKKSGVTVTCVCPGPVSTGFEAAANLHAEGCTMFKKLKPTTPEKVAAFVYKSALKGKVLAYHGFRSKLMNFSTKLAPRNIACKISAKVVGKPR